jgi:hypothetical protein
MQGGRGIASLLLPLGAVVGGADFFLFVAEEAKVMLQGGFEVRFLYVQDAV